MLLRSIRIDNFRALRCARICLEPTTVLIGENDCGRSSVMEAVALALGWNSAEGEFGFQPYHAHRPDLRSISIALEFCESIPGEWRAERFEALRRALPGALTPERRFCFEVTHDREGITRWNFRSARETLTDNRPMLGWLRRQMPVLWM